MCEVSCHRGCEEAFCVSAEARGDPREAEEAEGGKDERAEGEGGGASGAHPGAEEGDRGQAQTVEASSARQNQAESQ